jgi:subtilase family serine protease
VLATVDDVNRIPGELSESNNTRSVPLTVLAGPTRPDLVVTGVSWTPTSPAADGAVTFQATIKNQGTAATPIGVVHGVVFKVDGVARTWSDTSTASLAAGASRTVTANGGPAGKATWPGTAGQHTVQAVVDDINRIKTESDETNNASMPVPLNIGPAGSRPDLVVTGVSWSPSSPTPGSPVRFTATVKNIGTRSTPEGKVVGVSFRPNGLTTGATYSDTFTSHIAPGATATLTANGGGSAGAWTPPAGFTPIVAIVDDLNRIVEANEANNSLTAVTTPD